MAELTSRNTIAYYSSFLSKPNVDGIDITEDDKNAFMTCIHEMDRSRGLDLILHTPGGSIAAAESLVQYLRDMFGNNVRAIVPQISMSAGTMIALSCKSVLMGKQSSLGPIDPHLGGIPADVVVTEFKRALKEITDDPRRAPVWSPILGRYTPSFLTQCEYAVEWSKTFVKEALEINMLSSFEDKSSRASSIVDNLSSADHHKGHDRHIHIDRLRDLGVTVEALEDNQKLQDYVLTVHHCFVHTMTNTPCIKIIENQDGRAFVRNLSQSDVV
ncbi:hypothetical protein KCN53_01855 [Pacificimonas aurantium]|uniref:Serine protease n=1 Tax=Pacificimonas aurantium TaxID=1250540 RepID=A0ABS7WHD7_9SPHN|nr:hypothetical protein [Pacificimonas aurantium]